jgi:hypothetical protein
MVNKVLTRLALGLSVALLDFALIFVSWASHPGNVAVPEAAMPGAAILFEVTTFPAVTILPADIVNQFFWATIIGNSVLWGLIAIWLHTFYRWATSRSK